MVNVNVDPTVVHLSDGGVAEGAGGTYVPTVSVIPAATDMSPEVCVRFVIVAAVVNDVALATFKFGKVLPLRLIVTGPDVVNDAVDVLSVEDAVTVSPVSVILDVPKFATAEADSVRSSVCA